MPIEIRGLKYVYSPGGPFEYTALNGVDLSIQDGEFVGLIGHTGSGKSTLVQHLNGLLRPSEGSIHLNGMDLSDKALDKRALRGQVGLVFQYPEYQLFEETVLRDVMFGPLNMGIHHEQAAEQAREALEMVGLNASEVAPRSPFELSGGQKRRVALAGVLAMNPKVLVLDEPMAGLDPRGRSEIMALITGLQHRQGHTIIMVSHNMEEVARVASRIVVMEKGRVAMDGTPGEVFSDPPRLQKMGLDAPGCAVLVHALNQRGFELENGMFRIEQVGLAIAERMVRA